MTARLLPLATLLCALTACITAEPVRVSTLAVTPPTLMMAK
jgi:hypothetical protein